MNRVTLEELIAAGRERYRRSRTIGVLLREDPEDLTAEELERVLRWMRAEDPRIP